MADWAHSTILDVSLIVFVRPTEEGPTRRLETSHRRDPTWRRRSPHFPDCSVVSTETGPSSTFGVGHRLYGAMEGARLPERECSRARCTAWLACGHMGRGRTPPIQPSS